MERRRRRTAARLRWPEAEGRGDVLAGLLPGIFVSSLSDDATI